MLYSGQNAYDPGSLSVKDFKFTDWSTAQGVRKFLMTKVTSG